MTQNIIKRLVIVLGVFLLTSCQTTTDPDSQSKKVNAAKINDQLGMAYLERNDTQRAKQKFLLALEQAPHLPETWYSMGYYLEMTGNKDEAKRHYLKSITLAPTRGDALNNYGTFLCRQGDVSESVQYFIKATQDAQYLDIAGAYENAGLCSLKIKQYDHKKIKNYFIKALEQDPNRPSSLIELAELYYQEGNTKAANTMLNRFLKVSPPTLQSYRMEKKLNSA